MISAMPGQTTVETFSSSGTYLSTWFRQQFGDPDLAGAPDPALERDAAALPVGSERLLTLPYWNAAQTPHWDSQASGRDAGLAGLPHPRALLPVAARGHRVRIAHAARRFGGRARRARRRAPRDGRRCPQRAVDADPGRRLRPPARGVRRRRGQRPRRGRHRTDRHRRVRLAARGRGRGGHAPTPSSNPGPMGRRGLLPTCDRSTSASTPHTRRPASRPARPDR